jgi:hypothetical protein
MLYVVVPDCCEAAAHGWFCVPGIRVAICVAI